MTKLQFRIASILVGAVSLVVLVATLAAFIALTYPIPERMAAPVASQIRAIVSFISSDNGTLSHPGNADLAQLGPVRNDLSKAIAGRLADDGIEAPVVVYDNPRTGTPTAVIELGDNRIAVDFPSDFRPPLDLWIILGTWLALVVIGVIGVSLFMAYRVTQPFAVLERAVATVGPDGVLPHIPEAGSREAAETARMLNRLSERLRTAMESRMRLVAAAGHDFRTPMTRMRIRAEFLDEEERAAWLKDIDELERIADSAIGLVREEVSDIPLEPIALDQLLLGEVDDLVAQNYDLSRGRMDAITLPLPPLAMRRAIRNLLINAATHGRGGRVELIVNEHAAIINISDEGPGIPDDLLQHVFEPFFRAAPGRLQTIPGAGLGLALALEIIERIGGDMQISNRNPKGLEQRVTLPLGRYR